MIKKILYLITAINIFSLTEYEKEILKKIENTSYSCDVGDEKVIKIKGKDFVGHINEKGEFYGELHFPKEDNIRYCFLKDEYKVYLKKEDGFYWYSDEYADEDANYWFRCQTIRWREIPLANQSDGSSTNGKKGK